MTAIIYGLRGSDGIRYVGCTSKPLRARLSGHAHTARAKNTPLAVWLRTQIAAETLTIEPLYEVADWIGGEWRWEFETAIIIGLINAGHDLLNHLYTYKTKLENQRERSAAETIKLRRVREG